MFNLLGLVFLPLICQAAHFEGGTISYKVLNTSNSTVSIMISQTYIYVYPTIYCNNSYIINQSPPLNMAGRGEYGKYLNCTANCSTSGGYVPVPLDPYCTDYSSAMSITIGERLDVVNILVGSYFVVSFASNNWRPLSLPLGNGGSLAWCLSCTVDLRLRPNGALNHPPVAAIISPIYIPVGIQQAIFIPTIDADNDQVRCRFALNGSNECADVCPPASLPNGTVILSNCTLFITGTNVGDWYAVAIMIEDFANSTSNTPFSSVPVQFLINVQSVSSCPTRPLLTGPVFETGQCIGIQVGQTYVIQLIAENFCPNSTTIADIATLSFPIVIKTPIVRNTTRLWSISMTWTPTASSVGSQILCAVAIDSANVQSNQYCMTFTVAEGSVPTCPGQMAMTTQITSKTSLYTSTDMITTFTSLSILTTSESLTTSINLSSPLDTSSSTGIINSYFQETATSFVQPITSYTFETSLSTTLTTLQQSANVDTTNSSLAASSSGSTIPWVWIIALLAALALIFLALCLCCCHCCPLPCLFKRRQKRSLSKQFPQESNFIHPPIYSYMICNSSKNIPNDIIPTSRPPSSQSTQDADDVQLIMLSTPRKPHYTLALNRSPRKPHYTLALNRSPRITPSLPNVSS